MKYILKTLVIFLSVNLIAQNKKNEYQKYAIDSSTTYSYEKPKFFDILTKIPKDIGSTFQDIGKNENLIGLGTATALTLIIIPQDQKLLDESRIIGEKIGLKDVARYNSFGPFNNIPPNITSGIYLIGNGSTPIMLSVGFATYGLIKNDYRSLNTATGLMESLAVSGIFSQTIKRISGRQSPEPAIKEGNPGGNWNPFPSFKAFATHTPNYDAFPSGHLMTATAALYVITGNYPEIKWIKPVGLTLIGVLGFEMVQANVHWYSDYPIAIFMGYIIGKNIANNKIKKNKIEDQNNKSYSIKFSANRISGYNLFGAQLTF